jgi:hypothetical protein
MQTERRKKELVHFLSRGAAYLRPKVKVMQTERRKKELVLFFFFKHRRTIVLGDTTAPGYFEPLQTLNGELVLSS